MKCGIIGLPNAGKSTLFRALTALPVAAENYPFCTIEPNVGVVQVPDPRVEQISQIFKPEKSIYPIIEFVDIAGLVQGAHKGQGLGHKFLSHIREAQALLHVVRCFDNKDITHVCNTVDPLRDIEIIESELILADLETIQNRINKIEKLATSNKEAKLELECLKKLSAFLDKGQMASQYKIEKNEKLWIQRLHLLSIKPCLYVCNTSETESSYTKTVEEKVGASRMITISCQMESELLELNSSEQAEYLKSLGLKERALDRLIRKAYSLLNLITFFTAGPKEVRSWTVPAHTSAPQAGGTIHSDFEKGFIRAEVYTCEQLLSLKSEKNLKEKGLIRLEGKTYLIQDGDIVFFRFNT